MRTETHEHTRHCWWDLTEARWACPAERSIPDRPRVDVRDMLVVHAAMLREFRLAPAAVLRVAPGDRRAAALVERHLEFLCDMLHTHHQGEDELLWPLLRDRVPTAALQLIDEVEIQHGVIDAALQAVTTARSAWRSELTAENAAVLAGALEHAYQVLAAHLEVEETSVLPLAAELLTEAEWHAIGEHAAAATPKPALVLAFGDVRLRG